MAQETLTNRVDALEKTQAQHLEWFANIAPPLTRMDRRIELLEDILRELRAARHQNGTPQ